MALSVHTATDERLASPELVGFVRAALDAHGRAVVLVPSLQQALEVQRSLADAGVSLGVTVGTPASWAGERWEVWGDGRRVVDGVSRGLLAARVLSRAAGSGELSLEDTPGTAALLAELSRVGLPWFVRGPSPAPKAASEAERSLVTLLVELEANLRSCGFIEGCEVMADLPAVLAEGSVVVPPVAFAGFPWLSRAERALLDGLALRCEVALIRPSGETSVRSQRAAELEGLVSSLFGAIERPVAATGAVRLLLPAGPSAEAELVAREVLELVDAGCELASHTNAHQNLPTLDRDALRQEITSAADALEQASGVRPQMMRAPYGAFTEVEWARAGDIISTNVLWSIDTLDWERPGAAAITSAVLNGARNGSIVLMHDGGGNREQDIEALPGIIDGLRERGYTLVTVSELMRLDGRVPEEVIKGTVSLPEGAVMPEV